MAMLLLAFIFVVGALALFAYAFLTGEPKAQSKIAQRTPDETA